MIISIRRQTEPFSTDQLIGCLMRFAISLYLLCSSSTSFFRPVCRRVHADKSTSYWTTTGRLPSVSVEGYHCYHACNSNKKGSSNNNYNDNVCDEKNRIETSTAFVVIFAVVAWKQRSKKKKEVGQNVRWKAWEKGENVRKGDTCVFFLAIRKDRTKISVKCALWLNSVCGDDARYIHSE